MADIGVIDISDLVLVAFIISLFIIIITAICIAQNRLRATNALSGSSSTVTT